MSLEDSLLMDISFLEQRENIHSHFSTICTEFGSLRNSMTALQEKIQSECAQEKVDRLNEHEKRLLNLQGLCQRKKVSDSFRCNEPL